MHFLTDPFSKLGSRFFIELSAESISFKYCNSSITPNNFLGDYLDGTTNPSGNMYSVEKKFLDKFNNPSYTCANCQCQAYVNNHFTTSNSQGNILSGMMWGPYSMLKDHNLFKIKNNSSKAEYLTEAELIQLYDIQGRLLFQSKNMPESNFLPNGLYLKLTTFQDGKILKSKLLMSEDGIKNIVLVDPLRE